MATTKTDSPPVEVDAPIKSPKKFRRKKTKRQLTSGRVYIKSSFNNTLVSIADSAGNVIAATSSGACGFRGSKKGVAYAAQIAADKVATSAQQQFGLKKVDIFVKGIGQGREAAVRAIINKQFSVDSINDMTKIAHGGVRSRKARRV